MRRISTDGYYPETPSANMSLFKISVFVLAVHMAFILWGITHIPSSPVVKPNQTRLVTQEVTFNEKPKFAFKEEKKKTAEKPVPKEAEKPVVEKPVPKVVEKEKPKAVEKEKKVNEIVEKPKKKVIKDQALVEKAKENIAKITKTSDKIITSEPVPKEIPNPNKSTRNDDESALLNSHEAGYRDELANRLKLLLRLPEYGMVKIRLTVDRKGLVQKFDIVTAESEVNRRYIESAVPGLAFPAFGSNFSGESEHTFLISLNNEL